MPLIKLRRCKILHKAVKRILNIFVVDFENQNRRYQLSPQIIVCWRNPLSGITQQVAHETLGEKRTIWSRLFPRKCHKMQASTDKCQQEICTNFFPQKQAGVSWCLFYKAEHTLNITIMRCGVAFALVLHTVRRHASARCLWQGALWGS